MIYIAYKEYINFHNKNKNIYIYSDKSEQEAKQFAENTKNHYQRANTPKLGVYYYAELSIWQRQRNIERITENVPNAEIKDEDIYGFNLSNIEYKIINYDDWVKQRELEIKNRVCSNLNELNNATEQYLTSKFNFVHWEKEYTHSSLNVRADFFGVTEDRKVVTVEVKSDKDTLARLEKQLLGYLRFSHLVFIVCDIKHFHQVEVMIRDRRGLWSVGILVYENGELKEEHKPYKNRNIDTTNLLLKQELDAMLWGFKIKRKSTANIIQLENIIRDIFTVSEFYKLSEYLFVERYIKADTLDCVTKLYEDVEHKQAVIDRKYNK